MNTTCSLKSNLPNMTLDSLLDSLGFDEWKTYTASVVFPIINFVGIVFSSLSMWIFSMPNYTRLNPVFFYYRLLCLVFLIHSMHHLPLMVCFSPRYFPSFDQNSYTCSVYLAYNIVASNFMFHYEETLQIGILLNRMKTFSPFVSLNFNLTPKFTSLVFFLICFAIKLPAFFAFKIVSFGEYYYNDFKAGSINGNIFKKVPRLCEVLRLLLKITGVFYVEKCRLLLFFNNK